MNMHARVAQVQTSFFQLNVMFKVSRTGEFRMEGEERR